MMRIWSKQAAPIVVVMALSAAACGQVAALKAKKVAKEAHTLYQQQEYKRAAECYEEALQADPEGMGDLYFYLANSYDNLYKPSRQGEPENDQYLQKAVVNYKLGVDKAINPLVKRRSLEYLVAVYGADKLNDPMEAIPVVEQMIALDPKEPSMDARSTKHYERLLLTQRDRYQEALNRIESEEAESQGISGGDAVRAKDVADAASDTQEEEKDFAMANRLSRRITEVDEALLALRDAPDRFGICGDCGRPIERQRLELVPWSERCSRCASRANGAMTR
jgi:RNA polymerase-binding transcription factor DksA